MADVQLFTDGACRGNPGPGGWGVLLRSGGHEKQLWGGEALTTNNRMELTAAIVGLECLNRACSVENQDLWERLDAACATHEIRWHWVKGHAGHPENELADALANRGIDELLENS